METLEHLEILDDYAVYRPSGDVSFDQAVQMVTSILILARERRIRRVMAIVTDLTGFDSPDLGMRYWMVNEWAMAAAGDICLAVVARPEHIDPHKVGVLVGREMGLICDAFDSESEALTWLRSVRTDQPAT